MPEVLKGLCAAPTAGKGQAQLHLQSHDAHDTVHQFGILNVAMKISFIDAGMETLCRQTKVSVKKLGPLSARKLQTRLAELFNAKCVTELIAGAPHPLKGDRAGEFAVSLHGGDRLVFRPAQRPVPIRTDGSIDWSVVTEIVIIEAGDYHD